MTLKRLLPEVFMVLAAIPAFSDDSARFYKREKEGWFFYRERPPIEKPQRPPPASLPSDRQTDNPAPFSAAWLKTNLPKFRQRAIDDPSPQNVAAYFALQRLAIDKAERFARTAALLPTLYPELDENLRRPRAQFAANITDRLAQEGTRQALSEIASTCGLFFFFTSTCPHCQAQASVLEALRDDHGFIIFPISLDGGPLPGGQFPDYRIDSGQARALAVEVTPALFLVRPDAKEDPIRLIGQGAMALSDLERRIIEVAFAAGWIDRKTYEKTLSVKPMYLDSDSLSAQDLAPEGVLEALGIKEAPKPKELPF